MAGDDGKSFIKESCCMANQYFVVHGGARKNFSTGKDKFDWEALGNENPDMQGKILGFAGAKLKRTREVQRYLLEELLPQGMPIDNLDNQRLYRPKRVDVIETLVLERPRHDILSHGPHEKMTVTFSSCVDRNWWGFDKYAELGWALDIDTICNAMDYKQTLTDVIKIRLVPTHENPRFSGPHQWHVDVVRQREDGEDTVRIGSHEKNIDYLVHEFEGLWEFERRLIQRLHLRHRIVDDGASELSVV